MRHAEGATRVIIALEHAEGSISEDQIVAAARDVVAVEAVDAQVREGLCQFDRRPAEPAAEIGDPGRRVGVA